MRPGTVHTYRREWERLRAALTWRYGQERAEAILAAKDPDTNADIARWRQHGEKVGAA